MLANTITEPSTTGYRRSIEQSRSLSRSAKVSRRATWKEMRELEKQPDKTENIKTSEKVITNPIGYKVTITDVVTRSLKKDNMIEFKRKVKAEALLKWESRIRGQEAPDMPAKLDEFEDLKKELGSWVNMARALAKEHNIPKRKFEMLILLMKCKFWLRTRGSAEKRKVYREMFN